MCSDVNIYLQTKHTDSFFFYIIAYADSKVYAAWSGPLWLPIESLDTNLSEDIQEMQQLRRTAFQKEGDMWMHRLILSFAVQYDIIYFFIETVY